jgi:hypothetical protein
MDDPEGNFLDSGPKRLLTAKKERAHQNEYEE